MPKMDGVERSAEDADAHSLVAFRHAFINLPDW